MPVEVKRGIITGRNEAFIIDKAKRDELIKIDSTSEEIIKPILRGKNIRKYGYDFEDQYVILVKYKCHEYLEERYPAIYQYLVDYENTAVESKKLTTRGQCLNKKNGEGQHHWLELDNNPTDVYLSRFASPKIIYANMSKYLPFAYDESGVFTNQKCFIITSTEDNKDFLKALCGIFNSNLGKFWIKRTAPTLGNDRFELGSFVAEKFPIKLPTPEAEEKLVALVDEVLALKAGGLDSSAVEKEIDSIVYELYGLNAEEIEYIEGN